MRNENLSHTMIPVIVVSLERAAARRVKVSAHLRSNGYSFVLLPAIDCMELDPTKLKVDRERSRVELKDRPDAPGEMTLPEIASLMSHRRAWQFIADSGMPYAMVAEDDVVALCTAFEAEQRLWPFFNAEPDFKYIQCSAVSTDFVHTNETPTYWEMTNAGMGSFSYCISGAYAKKLLQMTAGLYIPTDVFIRRETNRTRGLFHLKACIFGHDDDGVSFLGHGGGVNHKPLV